MYLNLNVDEAATLLLHMKVMKKSVKKGFKSTYKDDWKERLAVYEGIVIKVEEKLKDVEENPFSSIELEVNETEHTMLVSFMNFYVQEINKQFNKKKEIKGKTIDQLATLENVMHKARALIC